MSFASCVFIAVLSVWDCASRQSMHDVLRGELVRSIRSGDIKRMEETSRKGTELLPEDPVWRYNHACALSYYEDRKKALDELEKAIDLGFRDADMIKRDSDLRRLSGDTRFAELVSRAASLSSQPITEGPLAAVPAKGKAGGRVVIGEKNLLWDFDNAAFTAKVDLDMEGISGGNAGDLYMNLDGGHSRPVVTNWPGLSEIVLDENARAHGLGFDFPSVVFPRPVFGNASRAFTKGPYWRSIPRALATTEARRLRTIQKLYLSNQIWVFPATDDFNFTNTNLYGDVFASVTPYWITVRGRSWSDQYYLRAALEISRSLQDATKREIVRKGVLAGVVQTIVRKSLKRVKSEDDYLTPEAHPTAMPPGGLDMERLKSLASGMRLDEIPPLVAVSVKTQRLKEPPPLPEATYMTPFASAFVLRADETERVFEFMASGAVEYAFRIVHDDFGAASIEQIDWRSARVKINKTRMTPVNRVDVAVFGRTSTSGWGPPSYISFAVVDPAARYSDPVLTPAPVKKTKDVQPAIGGRPGPSKSE